MIVTVRVRPGASRTHVGGRYAPDSGPVQLGVAVTARAVDGAATRAVLTAVADAFGVRPRQVELVSGSTARTKILRIDGEEHELAETLQRLLG